MSFLSRLLAGFPYLFVHFPTLQIGNTVCHPVDTLPALHVFKSHLKQKSNCFYTRALVWLHGWITPFKALQQWLKRNQISSQLVQVRL